MREDSGIEFAAQRLRSPVQKTLALIENHFARPKHDVVSAALRVFDHERPRTIQVLIDVQRRAVHVGAISVAMHPQRGAAQIAAYAIDEGR